MRVAGVLLLILCLLPDSIIKADGTVTFSGERKRNNLVSDLLEVRTIPQGTHTFPFTRPRNGWIFVSATFVGPGSLQVALGSTMLYSSDNSPSGNQVGEAVRRVAAGEHTLQVSGDVAIDKLEVRAIPDLVHSGLFNPAIKSYGPYDMQFLKKDVLPNITGLIVPSNIQLSKEAIDDWHRQGKTFIAEVGLGPRGTTADDLFKLYSNYFETMPFLDGVIINEFGMNREPHPERRERAAARHRPYEEAFRRMRADDRYKGKTIYNYFGGSGNLVNFDDTGETFCGTLVELNNPIALERYLFERSSEQGSADALQRFIDGITDWEAKVPGAQRNMLLSFGLFNAPPGGINKLPNVDYHVWMDQQMHVVATHPSMTEMGGINWWTSSQADEDSVRFVGQLYRHYGIEGRTDLLTRDPLFMTHLHNADFEKGLEGWTLHAAEAGSIDARSFPRYGRIEGRYMGLGRPADPEHIGDTFLWMQRSAEGPNTVSQQINDLEPGRLYSLKMFTCDYRDLTEPQQKTLEQANRFRGRILLDGVEVDTRRSFREAYSSNPEPKIPVWITYHWTIFRAKETTAQLTVSDWESDADAGPFGQEQTFNFLELQPYRE